VQSPDNEDAFLTPQAEPKVGEPGTPGVRARVRTALQRLAGDAQHQHAVELIATLNEVADAVSSALNIDEVLEVIVERAKRITDTDKAVLVLGDTHGEHVDLDTIVVRGRMSQHQQDWWEQRLDDAAERAMSLGRPFVEDHPEQHAIAVFSPVMTKDNLVGLLCVINSADRPFTTEQIDFLAVLSAFASSAIENARLAEQSRYVLLASERDRIAREMHDGVVQSLFSISLGLEVCKKQVVRDPVAVAERLEELQQHLNTSMTELRRFIYDLRPMKLAELGLVGAVEYWVREVTLGRPVKGRVRVHGEAPRLAPAQEACLYRIAKESVSNVIKHSGAREFEVILDFSEDNVVVSVRDNGSGFDVGEATAGGSDGMGLRSIADRVDRDGGRLEIESVPGSGTLLRATLPVGGTA